MNPKMSLVTMLLAGTLPLAAVAAEQMKSPAAIEREATPMQPAPPGAQPPPGAAPATTEVPPLFKELDRDSDGQISKDEAKRSAETQAQFETLDANGDGKISLAEWKAQVKEPTTGKL